MKMSSGQTYSRGQKNTRQCGELPRQMGSIERMELGFLAEEYRDVKAEEGRPPVRDNVSSIRRGWIGATAAAWSRE